MRGRLYATTALITRDGPLESPGAKSTLVVSDISSESDLGPAVTGRPAANNFNDHCLCSDGEIYLQDEDHLERLLRGPV